MRSADGFLITDRFGYGTERFWLLWSNFARVAPFTRYNPRRN